MRLSRGRLLMLLCTLQLSFVLPCGGHSWGCLLLLRRLQLLWLRLLLQWLFLLVAWRPGLRLHGRHGLTPPHATA